MSSNLGPPGTLGNGIFVITRQKILIALSLILT